MRLSCRRSEWWQLQWSYRSESFDVTFHIAGQYFIVDRVDMNHPVNKEQVASITHRLYQLDRMMFINAFKKLILKEEREVNETIARLMDKHKASEKECEVYQAFFEVPNRIHFTPEFIDACENEQSHIRILS